jgi:hypothetical protein
MKFVFIRTFKNLNMYKYVIHKILIQDINTWTHRRGHTSKIKIEDGRTAVSSAILETPEDDQCWSKHVS